MRKTVSPARQAAGVASTLVLGRASELAVSTPHVQQILETQSSGEIRATARICVAVSHALGEQVRAANVSGVEPWTVDVEESAEDLARRAGLPKVEVRAALDRLVVTGVAHRLPDPVAPRLRLGEEVFARQPVLAQVDWEVIRRSFLDEDLSGALPGGLAVLRELAALTAARTPDARGEWVRATVGEICAVTGYQRGAVMAALRLLEAFGLVEVGRRAGRSGGYRLLPAAFGAERLRRAPAGRARVGPIEGEGSASLVARIAGVEIRLAAGTRLDVPPGWDVQLAADSAGHPVLEVRPPSGDAK